MSRTKADTATSGPELTARSIVVGLIVAVVIGSAYPYCVLKLGFGPNLLPRTQDQKPKTKTQKTATDN